VAPTPEEVLPEPKKEPSLPEPRRVPLEPSDEAGRSWIIGKEE
jgi:hypothetical protein